MRRGQSFVPDSMRVEVKDRTNWGDLFSEPQDSLTSTGSYHPTR
jgi:hypothetical protein